MFWHASTETMHLVNQSVLEKFSNKEELLASIYEERSKSGKLMLLEKLLTDWQKEGQNKVLIFS